MRIILLFLFVTTFNLSYGQSTGRTPTLTKEDYLKKSKTQKTLYRVTGATGLVLFLIGGIMYMSEYENGLPGGTGYNDATSKTGETLMYVGGGLALISIPFRIAYKKNEKIAASLSFRNSRFPDLKKANNEYCFVPSVSLNFFLGK